MTLKEKPNKYCLSANALMKKIFPLLLYTGLIIYGSLYPFIGWRWPDAETASVLKGGWPAHISRGDLVTNLLVYAPLGYFLLKNMKGRMGNFAVILAATFIGSSLSFAIEFFQMFLPSRVSSLSDVVLNGISTFGGVLAALHTGENTSIKQRLLSLRRMWFLSGRTADIGLAAVGLWAASQLAPFVPSLDWGGLKNGLKPLWHTLLDPGSFNVYQAAAYALSIGGLAGIATLVMRDKNRMVDTFAFFVATVLICKIIVVGRQLSLEAVAGVSAGFAMFVQLRSLPHRVIPVFAALLILASFVVDELRPVAGSHAVTYEFNWIPFRGQLASESGFVSILEGLWPFTALAYLALEIFPQHHYWPSILGGLFSVFIVAGLEYMQQFIPGRYPDITQALLAVVGWALPWIVGGHETTEKTNTEKYRSVRVSKYQG